MEINNAFKDNMKLIREQRKLSLDALAKLTGVSKSMLAQIERGDGNPTIATVWKIASGLKVPFTQLVTKPQKDYMVVEKSAITALIGDGGRYRNYPIFPYGDSRKFEILTIELDPGAFLSAEAHPEGTQEFITVFSGEIEVSVNDERLSANTERAVRFKADHPHTYKNSGNEICRLSMVISYA